jgi:chemotaxis-related protein WspD
MPNVTDAVFHSALPALKDCWNQIGTQGDGTCPELAEHIHCRNCPVYSAAAAALLDREPPAGYLSEWTSHFARGKKVSEPDTLSVVVFRIGAEWLALPVTMVKEISELKPIHSLPHRRDKVVLGLVNFRGELLICVSLAEALSLEKASPAQPGAHRGNHPYLLIILHAGGRLVFRVDEVEGIRHFNMKEMKTLPSTVAQAELTYTMGLFAWGDKSIGYLDGDLLFYALGKSLS